MKTSCATFAVVLVALCFTSTALAETPAPIPLDVPQIAVFEMPQFYYSETRSVMRPPHFTRHAESIIAILGKDSGFYVEFTGDPLPTIYVYFNARKIDINKIMPNKRNKYDLTCIDGICAFTIKAVQESDVGLYSFEIENINGTARTEAQLTVEEYE